jgi:S-adenosylmethionine synthetase (AdoMet synthetase)
MRDQAADRTDPQGHTGGEVGRGNRLSDLFSVTRPASNEAAAGKNPFYHVGNIYNILARRIASEAAAIAGVREATVYLVGQIGMPIAQPHLCAAQLALAPGVGLDDVRRSIEAAFEKAARRGDQGPRETLELRHRGRLRRSRRSPVWFRTLPVTARAALPDGTRSPVGDWCPAAPWMAPVREPAGGVELAEEVAATCDWRT